MYPKQPVFFIAHVASMWFLSKFVEVVIWKAPWPAGLPSKEETRDKSWVPNAEGLAVKWVNA